MTLRHGVHFGGSPPRKPRDPPSTTSPASATITTIATPALGRQHKITLSVTKSAPSLYTLHLTLYTKQSLERSDKCSLPLTSRL